MDSSRVGGSSLQNVQVPPSDASLNGAAPVKKSFLGKLVTTFKGKKEPGLGRANDTDSLSKPKKIIAKLFSRKIRKINWRRAGYFQQERVSKLQGQNGKSDSINSVKAYDELASKLQTRKEEVEVLENKVKEFESTFSDALKLFNKDNFSGKDLKKVKNLKIPTSSGSENIKINSSSKGQIKSQVKNIKDQFQNSETQDCFNKHCDNKNKLTEAKEALRKLEGQILFAYGKICWDLGRATSQEYKQEMAKAEEVMKDNIAKQEADYKKGIAELKKDYHQNIEKGGQKAVHVNSSLDRYKANKSRLKKLKEKNITNAKKAYKVRMEEIKKARDTNRQVTQNLIKPKQATETTAPSVMPVDMESGASKLLEKFNTHGYLEGKQWQDDIKAIFDRGDVDGLETVEKTLKQWQANQSQSAFKEVLKFIKLERAIRLARS
ncbi:hypothetical protein ACTL6P_13560 [Endozoicomonas acroporae]|uniref:hypothetical protein n=1 Tax=Endozoicomonas acroporae TaxID=1701104 RepID=UPI000C77A5E8|nr:hypothetical protein [Endozoicomonas acroporae]